MPIFNSNSIQLLLLINSTTPITIQISTIPQALKILKNLNIPKKTSRSNNNFKNQKLILVQTT